ncbi:DMT family transporter [candidate division KSB1 bacterium]|nr:DMT family transporter [candidate division KSB1 bacterium]
MDKTTDRLKLAIVLSSGLVTVSMASVLIKLCSAPSAVIAMYRLGIAAIFFCVFTRLKLGPSWSRFTREQRRIAILSGIFLTIHFISWITSLKFTSVASSVVLVQSAPIFVALGSFLFLAERPPLLAIPGIAIVLLGGLLIGFHDFSLDENSLFGNLLAVGGAVGAAGYVLAGRKLRATVDTFQYVTVVYSISAMMLAGIVILNRLPVLGYNAHEYLLLIAIAIFPQIIGHTSFNWALKYISATAVSVILLAEPIGASILAFVILGEMVSLMKAIGGLIILCGVGLVLYAESKTITR